MVTVNLGGGQTEIQWKTSTLKFTFAKFNLLMSAVFF